MAGREQQVALMRVEGQSMDLTCMLVQSDELHAGTIQVVQDDFAVGNSSGNMRAELAMRPFYVLDAEALALACMRISIVEHGGTQIGVVDDLGAVDTDCFEDVLASEHGMGPLTVDVEGGNVETGLVGCIEREAGAGAAWGQRLQSRGW